MSAGPDGRYVRCTARDWGEALLYWWAVMFPVYVCGVVKFSGFVFRKIGKISVVAGRLERLPPGIELERLEARP